MHQRQVVEVGRQEGIKIMLIVGAEGHLSQQHSARQSATITGLVNQRLHVLTYSYGPSA